MSNDLVKFKQNLTLMADQGELPLPSTVPLEAFKSAAIVAFQTNPQVRKATPASLFTALRQIAGMGLMPDGREAAIVVYGDKAQAQPMVSGLRKIARNSGQVVSMWEEVVFEGEDFVFRVVDGERKFDHLNADGTPLNPMKRKRGQIIGAYAVAKLKDGTIEFEAMDREQIEKRRKASPNQKGDKATGIWADWHEEMCRKTVLRALVKRLPMSTEDYNRLQNDPTFRDVDEPRDVTPQETTEERLRRLAMERQAPKEETPPEAAPEPVVEDAVVVDGYYQEGRDAHAAGKQDTDCPYPHNSPEMAKWVDGFFDAMESQ
jgi:recombination protein RecT